MKKARKSIGDAWVRTAFVQGKSAKDALEGLRQIFEGQQAADETIEDEMTPADPISWKGRIFHVP